MATLRDAISPILIAHLSIQSCSAYVDQRLSGNTLSMINLARAFHRYISFTPPAPDALLSFTTSLYLAYGIYLARKRRRTGPSTANANDDSTTEELSIGAACARAELQVTGSQEASLRSLVERWLALPGLMDALALCCVRHRGGQARDIRVMAARLRRLNQKKLLIDTVTGLRKHMQALDRYVSARLLPGVALLELSDIAPNVNS